MQGNTGIGRGPTAHAWPARGTHAPVTLLFRVFGGHTLRTQINPPEQASIRNLLIIIIIIIIIIITIIINRSP